MALNASLAMASLMRAKEKFKAYDLTGARREAYEALRLCSSIPGLRQTIAAFDVLFAASTKKLPGGAIDWFAVLGIDPSVDLDAIKKRHKKLCLLTHPDKNPSAAAGDAFKLVMQAWDVLSSSCVAALRTAAKPSSSRQSTTRRTGPSTNKGVDDDESTPAGRRTWKGMLTCPCCSTQFQSEITVARTGHGGGSRCRMACPACDSWVVVEAESGSSSSRPATRPLKKRRSGL